VFYARTGPALLLLMITSLAKLYKKLMDAEFEVVGIVSDGRDHSFPIIGKSSKIGNISSSPTFS